MSLEFTLDGEALTHGVKPSTVLLPTRAEMGDVSHGSIPVEDPDATLVTVAWRPLIVEESACSQPRLVTGYTDDRGIARKVGGGLIVQGQRIAEIGTGDCNAAAAFRPISGVDGNRPEETWDERLTWIRGSDYLAGLIGTSSAWIDSHDNPMDAADYRGGGFAAQVLDDLANRFEGAMNWFFQWSPATSAVELAMFGIDDVIGDCTLRVSSVEADQDGATTFAPDTVVKLAREGDQTFSEVEVIYPNGRAFRSRATTAAAFIRRGTSISRPHTGKASTAAAQAEQFLDLHATETDRITCTMMTVPAASVGLVRAGQRIQVKFSHAAPEGYGDFTWMRIVACTPVPVSDVGGAAYDIALELVGPKIVLQECVTAVTFSDLVTAGPTVAGSGWPTITITPSGGPCVIVGIGLAANHNTPNDSDWVSAAGYTTLFADGSYPGGANHPLSAVLYKAVASPSGAYTPGGTYTGGYAYTTDSRWGMGAFAIMSGDTAPVQDASAVLYETDPSPSATFPGSPAAGNAIVMVVFIRDYYSYGSGGNTVIPSPNDGQWVQLGYVDTWMDANGQAGQGVDRAYVFVRCVAAGDGTEYGVDGFTKSINISLSEWTATGTADTSTDLGPITVQTTTHTTDPTINDDGDAGYPVGSTWINETSGDVFVSVDATTGAAVWQSTTSSGVTDHGALTGLADDDHTQYVLKRYGGKEVVSTVAATGATETIDLANGNVFDETLTADCTFTFTGATNGVACSFTLVLRQDGTGGWDVTWPGSVVWADGTAPTLDTTASTASVLTFFTLDGGTVWYGFPTGGGGGTAATTVESETALGIASAVGTDTEYARQDHTHGSPSAETIGLAGRWELVMTDGVTVPPVPLTNEAEDDWLYGWVA